jgi:hypothetical protein
MTFITVLATLCHLTAAGVEGCVEEIVTDNTLDDTLTMQSCMMGQAYIAKWMSEHPKFHTNWRLAKWGCRIGNKPSPEVGGKA